MILKFLEKLIGKSKKKNKLETAVQIPEIKLLGRTDYTRKRVIGTEQEYGVWSSEDNANFEIKTGKRFISNGGLVYADCSHPEYASPETSNPLDAVIYSKAGETIIKREVKEKSRFFKHITDGNGNFFGAHESYTLKRGNLDNLIDKTLPFFTTRIIFAGSGGINGEYEISQKARRINYDVCSGTVSEKSIFNTRDEPLADGKKYRRLHLISGDANMSEIAEYLKLGTTSLILDLYEDGKLKTIKIENALDAFHDISKDLKLKKKFKVRYNGEMTAIDIQRMYQEGAESAYRGRDSMTDDILDRWKFVLEGLESQESNKLAVLDTWLDWRIKKKLIDSYMNQTGKKLSDTAVRNIDLLYHEVDKEKGLFYILQNNGLIERLLRDEQIDYAVDNPPEDTRAWIRGKAVGKGIGVYWDTIYKGTSLSGDPNCKSCGKKPCNDHRNYTFVRDPLNNYSELKKEL